MRTPCRHPLVALMALVAVVCACMLFPACSLKKNTAATRHYMAFITRYNVYYNGDEHYKYSLHEQETSYKDDLSRTLYLSPIEAKADPATRSRRGVSSGRSTRLPRPYRYAPSSASPRSSRESRMTRLTGVDAAFGVQSVSPQCVDAYGAVAVSQR